MIALVVLGVMLMLTGIGLAALMAAGVRLPERPRRPRARATGPGRGRVRGRLLLVAVAVGVAVLAATGWVAAGLGAAGLVLAGPSLLSPAGASAAHITRLQGLASWTRRLADLLASGAAATLAQAITRAAATAPASIAVQARALSERIGPQGLEPALRAFARELADPVGDHVAMALIVRARHGGTGLAAVLTALASDVDEQVRMRQVVLAEQRKQVGNVRMILAVVLLTWVGLLVFTRPYLAPYASPAGQLVLAVIMAGFAACLAWMMRRLRPVVGQRLLADPPGHPSDPTRVGVAS